VTSGPVNVRDELLAAVAPLRPLAEARGLSLTADGPAVLALADAEALRRVVEILVDNAIKFTERGGISVSTASTPGGVLLRVADTGAGIAPSFVPHLFEAFRQESDGNARTHEGSGVGLAIARSLVDRMGGEISAESAPGRGSVFTVRLRRWVPAERAAAAPISA
jgi:signal transduction histidine kinase